MHFTQRVKPKCQTMPGPLKPASAAAPACRWLGLHLAADLLEGCGQHGRRVARPGDWSVGHEVGSAICSALGTNRASSSSVKWAVSAS